MNRVSHSKSRTKNTFIATGLHVQWHTGAGEDETLKIQTKPNHTNPLKIMMYKLNVLLIHTRPTVRRFQPIDHSAPDSHGFVVAHKGSHLRQSSHGDEPDG
jgi:hypothetical protein